MKERIDATQDLVEIQMDHRRNELVALDLIVTVVTAAFTWVAMIAGFFGCVELGMGSGARGLLAHEVEGGCGSLENAAPRAAAALCCAHAPWHLNPTICATPPPLSHFPLLWPDNGPPQNSPNASPRNRMNLYNANWGQSKAVFTWTTVICGGGAIIMLLASFAYMRRQKLLFISNVV